MFIVLHCGGLPFNGNTINERSLGGSETAAYYVAKGLAAHGHKVTVFTNDQNEGQWDGVRYTWAGPATQHMPLGERFHWYAGNTPHDVLIIQRHPQAFSHKWASKVNLWWTHDLALKRTQPALASQMWNVDAVLTVSEFHSKQIAEVYGLPMDLMCPIGNGIDLGLFEKQLTMEDLLHDRTVSDEIALLYTSRPERGLEHHVRPGGIMERLWDIDKRFHLYVCGYENTTPQMKSFYEMLWARCEELPNVTRLGALTKQQLADVMRQCNAHVYPTEFEEVSCITAMEAAAAGLPFISSEWAALPETCGEDTGSVLIPLKEGRADEDKFIETLKVLFSNKTNYAIDKLKKKQLKAAPRFTWSTPVGHLLNLIHATFLQKTRKHAPAVMRGLEHNSDIYALQEFAQRYKLDKSKYMQHINKIYAFAFNNDFKAHYDAVYKREEERGVNYGPEDLTQQERFRAVAYEIEKLIKQQNLGSAVTEAIDGEPQPQRRLKVLDYGCAHGHYTMNLARAFPQVDFVGVDIAASNIDKADQWLQETGYPNVKFYIGELMPEKEENALRSRLYVEDLPIEDWRFDGIIAAEVLEHVHAPWDYVNGLSHYLNEGGKFIITTPYGPWEAEGYEEHDPWRAHIHHFERGDLKDMFGHHKGYAVTVVPGGQAKQGEPLGSYLTVFHKPEQPSRAIDYYRKLNFVSQRDTVSLCMIVRDAEATVLKTLRSVRDVIDEAVIAVDEQTQDKTKEVIRRFFKTEMKRFVELKLFTITSPLETGFDVARNKTLDKAKMDWILWIDADETLAHARNVFKYLRPNMFNAYAIAQHHLSVEPVGCLKTDYPARLFRRSCGARFIGVVHEHPEVEFNKGIEPVMVVPNVSIAHPAYETEMVRRGRFERNIDLMVRDREKYPDRILGKFLWLRDLSQMCGRELQVNGGVITNEMVKRARMGVQLWEELLDGKYMRMVIDGMGFYSSLVAILGQGFDFGVRVDASKLNGGVNLERAQPVMGRFASREHAQKLVSALIDERTQGYESRYY